MIHRYAVRHNRIDGHITRQAPARSRRNHVYGVGDAVRSTIAESCKATVFKLIKFKESTEPDSWHLKYRTLVKEAGTHSVVSDSRMITFPAMDGPSMLEFKRWAIQQLRETTDAVNAEIEQGPVATKKRNRVMALLKMLVGRS